VRTTVTPKVTQHKATTVAGPTRTKTITDYTTVHKSGTTTLFSTVTSYVTTTDETDTLTITSDVSATTTVATTTTATTVTVDATFTACPLLQWTGPNQGEFLTVDDNNNEFLYWTSDITEAVDFALDGNSQLVATNLLTSTLLVLALPDTSSYVPVQGDYQPGDDGITPLTCSFDVNYFLTCVPTGGGPNNIWISTGFSGTPYLAFGENSDLSNTGYSEITIVSLCR
jgi:hypothetical protein